MKIQNTLNTKLTLYHGSFFGQRVRTSSLVCRIPLATTFSDKGNYYALVFFLKSAINTFQ